MPIALKAKAAKGTTNYCAQHRAEAARSTPEGRRLAQRAAEEAARDARAWLSGRDEKVSELIERTREQGRVEGLPERPVGAGKQCAPCLAGRAAAARLAEMNSEQYVPRTATVLRTVTKPSTETVQQQDTEQQPRRRRRPMIEIVRY